MGQAACNFFSAAGERPVYRVLRLAGRAVTRVISVIALAVAWELFARSGAVTIAKPAPVRKATKKRTVTKKAVTAKVLAKRAPK